MGKIEYVKCVVQIAMELTNVYCFHFYCFDGKWNNLM